MPFNADIRAGTMRIELNVGVIAEEVKNTLEEEDHDAFDSLDYTVGSAFWLYVYELENAYDSAFNSSPISCPKFYDWFIDNYNNVQGWNDILSEMDSYVGEQLTTLKVGDISRREKKGSFEDYDGPLDVKSPDKWWEEEVIKRTDKTVTLKLTGWDRESPITFRRKIQKDEEGNEIYNHVMYSF